MKVFETCPQCGKIIDSICDVCAAYVAENVKENETIGFAIRDGHAMPCAYRLAWGDGECECGVSKRWH